MQKMLSASCLAVFLSGAAFGTVYEVNVPTGNVQTNFTAEQKAAIAALGEGDEINKTGGGMLQMTVDTDIKSFKGTIRISDGVYRTLDSGSGKYWFGTTNGPTIVESGATVCIATYTSIANGGGEEFRLSGKGYGDMGGAIVSVGQNVRLGRLTLLGDTTVYAPTDIVSFYRYPVDMGGHTLTMKGLANFQPSVLTNPGHLIFDGNGVSRYVEVPQFCDFPGGPEMTMTFTNGAYAYFYEYPHTNRVYWTLRVRSNDTYGLYSRSYTGQVEAHWYGPVELPESGTTTFYAKGRNLHLHGEISGGASISVAGESGGSVHFQGTNTYTGSLSATAGRAVSYSELATPGLDDDRLISVNNTKDSKPGIYFVGTNAAKPYAWTPERIGQAFRKFRTAGKWNVGLYADAGEETVCELPDIDPDDLSYSGQYFVTLGGGRKVVKVNFIDGFRLPAMYYVSDLVWSAKDPETANYRLGQIDVYYGSSVRFENMGYVGIGGYPYIGRSQNSYASCVVGTNTVFGAAYNESGELLSKGLYVSCGKNCHAAAWILPGAILSNGVWVGTAAQYTNSCGMLVQKGGLVRSDVNNNNFGVARWGMGYYELAGGRFASTTSVTLGLNRGSSGHIWQTGGEFEMLASTFQIGGMGTGLVHVAGGTFRSAVAAYAPKSTSKSDRTAGCGRISVRNGTRPCFEAGVLLADRIDSLGLVELTGGGVLEAKSVTKCAKTSEGSVSTGDAKAYVNFNGGGVCAISNSVELLGTGNTAVDRATVYAAGAILEAAEGISANVSVPLQAPTGGGIASLALPEESFDAYHCAPLVLIYGDGEGAAAVAEYDSDNDVITNIVVTSPGWGYTAENTTAVLHWCGHVNRPDVALTVTVAANAATGGVTKRGPGRIALTAANTYGGGTTVEQGTLALASADAIPSGSAVTVKAGATLELGSGVGYPVDLTADLTDAVPGTKYALISCPDGVPAGEPAFKGLEGCWTVRLRGTEWTAAYERGTLFLVR